MPLFPAYLANEREIAQTLQQSTKTKCGYPEQLLQTFPILFIDDRTDNIAQSFTQGMDG